MPLNQLSKKCARCGQVKAATEFSPRTDGGLKSRCKPCRAAMQKAAVATSPERLEYQRNWQKNNPDKMAGYRRKKIYKLSPESYSTLWRLQEGCCLICSRPLSQGKLTHVDHDHKTGEVRGLLCGNCNQGLGNFRDNPQFLRSAADYLELFK